ncbi:DUF6600 domain-containing protein [Paucibacter sp. DJ2R-2]|uniref:DUF6600 domain-containing protein n=1 Tax=Paucibacter sp. DJ2R-2 TaxID=2893558 RepID=UPI0021E3A126|nr:DUF6600 domain-containing protein [Paucibacter sp. DJ2R-2]MCV2421518.1 hypothetical protein [Paucibacter sp. DJ4R-1]MCV2438223.1 hypothetical protein [Paucibacter sp. DJ2R-2]
MKVAARNLSATAALAWAWRSWLCLACLVLGLSAWQLAHAQAAPGSDPPTRAGRVSEVIGEAWLFDAENKEWTRVLRNQTISEGDRLRTDDRSRVSLRVGSSSFWLDERSDLEISQLDEGRVLLMLAKGDMGLRLRSQEAVSEYKVMTREGLFFAEREGLYRVEQMDRGSRGFALQGRLRFESSKGEGTLPVWLQDGEQAEFWWAGGPRTERQRLQGDGFIDWLNAQSRSEGDSINAGLSQRYVSPEMTGAEDLDRHGRWEQSPEYGAVWFPSVVVADWAPYRYGHWAWTRHWGWSWVDDAPWGFAPFHYGRWVSWNGRWCWSPGRYVARPVYAPALVAWVGGPSVSVGISIGGGARPPRPHYGWYPLAPREVYVPGFRHSPGYVQRLNNHFDRDPVTVNKPRSNREVGGAISYLPGAGGPVRAMPAADSGPVRPLPAAPARQELATMLPQRPAMSPEVPAGRSAADVPWRNDNPFANRRRDQQVPREERDAREQRVGPQRGELSAPAPQSSGGPADLPWRGRDRDRDRAAPPVQAQPQAPAQPAVPPNMPWADRPGADRSERAGPQRPDRGDSRMERQFERPAERPMEQRPVERPPERMRSAEPSSLPMRPAPAPQPQAQPQQPSKSESQGPQRDRGNSDGPPRRNGERER